MSAMINININEFNINDEVLVELTPAAWKKIETDLGRLERIPNPDFVKQYMDMLKRKTTKFLIRGKEKMLTKFTLWDLMSKFGDELCAGADSPFENCNIYSLKPVNTFQVEMEYENA